MLYPQLVKSSWKRDFSSVSQALHYVRSDAITFSRDVFGNILQRKRKLGTLLRGIQRTLEHFDSAALITLQRGLLKEYKQILFQEETMWFQKSHERWIRLGSRNATFFHAQTIIRRKRNKIHGRSRWVFGVQMRIFKKRTPTNFIRTSSALGRTLLKLSLTLLFPLLVMCIASPSCLGFKG